jgi:peroxiredoxin/predicted 2-oxoglutarate/Fe(II)-dependent dioxygenase YbiX
VKKKAAIRLLGWHWLRGEKTNKFALDPRYLGHQLMRAQVVGWPNGGAQAEWHPKTRWRLSRVKLRRENESFRRPGSVEFLIEESMAKPSLTIGESFPWIIARSTLNEQFNFSSTAGRYNVICFFGSAANSESRQVLDAVLAIQKETHLFDIENYLFTGVSVDPEDESLARVKQEDHAIRWFWDFDFKISQQVSASDHSTASLEFLDKYNRQTIVLDERLRVLRVFPFLANPTSHVVSVVQFLRSLPLLGSTRRADVHAPVLVVPRIFEPELCRTLIDHYKQQGGEDSGFMREVDGMTVAVKDYSHKRRTDCRITDERLRHACMVRIHDRLAPEILKAFQFHSTRMERYIVARYDAASNDHFRPHRDNTTRGTAHRRFAVSLVLNADEFQGGYLRFPEFGRQLFAPPTGGAVVFSCSLLHEATPVTAGQRFVFLPFLYDDAAAKVREENFKYLAAN